MTQTGVPSATVVGNVGTQLQTVDIQMVADDNNATTIFMDEQEVVQASKRVIACRVVLYLAILVLITNVLALLWYATGGEENGWQERHAVAGPSYAYLVAIHWSLCQYTFASMEVVPNTESERVFGCLVPLVSVLVAYPLIAAIVVGVGRLGYFPPEGQRKPKLLLCRVLALFAAFFAEIILITLIWLRLGEDSLESSWTYEYNLEDSTGSFRFFTALHWVMSQYTFSTMEVVPTNMQERSFTIVVQFVGLVTTYPMIAGIVLCIVRLAPMSIQVA
mmetsp:Transcript_73434/g.185499  ORF Transcript_73434/g.185499 Transcript_73434/m.185499 type:complete len:276 (-) Transcript_73434:43-870(-)